MKEVLCSSLPGQVLISHHAVQHRREAAGGGGSEGLWVIRAQVVGVAEVRVHMRIRCKLNKEPSIKI